MPTIEPTSVSIENHTKQEPYLPPATQPVRTVVWVMHLALPMAGLWLLLANPATLDIKWQHNPSHFWLIIAVAGINVVLGAMINQASTRRADARLFLVSLVFLGTAGFFLMHGLATPKVILDGPNYGFDLAHPVGLLVASIFAFVSALPLNERAAQAVLRSQVWLSVGLVLLLAAWGFASLVSGLDPAEQPVSAPGRRPRRIRADRGRPVRGRGHHDVPAPPQAPGGHADQPGHRLRTARRGDDRRNVPPQLAPVVVAVAHPADPGLRLRRLQRLHAVPARGHERGTVRLGGAVRDGQKDQSRLRGGPGGARRPPQEQRGEQGPDREQAGGQVRAHRGAGRRARPGGRGARQRAGAVGTARRAGRHGHAVQNAVDRRDMGVATSSATFTRQIGGTLGTAVFLSILFSQAGTKISEAFAAIAPTAGVPGGAAQPDRRRPGDNKAFIQQLQAAQQSGGSGAGVGGSALSDSSFINQLDPRARQAVPRRLLGRDVGRLPRRRPACSSSRSSRRSSCRTSTWAPSRVQRRRRRTRTSWRPPPATDPGAHPHSTVERPRLGRWTTVERPLLSEKWPFDMPGAARGGLYSTGCGPGRMPWARSAEGVQLAPGEERAACRAP